jgi:hypothetical protein
MIIMDDNNVTSKFYINHMKRAHATNENTCYYMSLPQLLRMYALMALPIHPIDEIGLYMQVYGFKYFVCVPL